MSSTSGVGSSVFGALAGAPSASRPEGLPEDMQNRPGRDSNDAQGKGGDLISSLPSDVFGEGICGFLEPKDLCACIQTCRVWNERLQCDKTWENLCQIAFGANALPAREGSDISYKDVFQRLHKRFLGQLFYERYIGSVGQVPPIPPHLSPFVLLNRPDPCDPDKTVGKEYVWMYVPSHFYVHSRSEVRFEEFYSQGFQVEGTGKDRAVKVPVTINNLPKLFARPKEGHPSKYDYIWNVITNQHGDTEHPGGWICMRREVFDRGRSWDDQKTNALAREVIIPQLVQRILLNFSWNVRSGGYLDRKNPLTYARTSAMVTATSDPLACGFGSPSGLVVNPYIDHDSVGVAVALPE